MSAFYRPANGAVPVPPWSTAYLSERDLTLQIPLNYVTDPAVSLTAACFANGIYSSSAAELCFSNLLATGFRKLQLDLYWDRGRRSWSFCPVEGIASRPVSSTSSVGASSAATATVLLVTQSTATRDTTSSSSSFRTSSTSSTSSTLAARRILDYRQLSGSASGSTLSSALSTPTGSSTRPTINATTTTTTPQTTSINGATLYVSGPYACSEYVDFALFTSLLQDYLRSTSNTIDATMNQLYLNLHVAASRSAPLDRPVALNGSALPQPNELISSFLNANLSSFLYTPMDLQEERADVNASWNNVASGFRPDSQYYNASLDSRGVLVTSNGWPSESFVEFKRLFRLMATFTGIDQPQLALYNSSGDAQTIFPVDYTYSTHEITYSSNDVVSAGCFFNPDTTQIMQTNNSWSLTSNLDLARSFTTGTSNGTNQTTIWPTLSNVTSCGVSPFINASLGNATADVDFRTYQSFAYSSLWSWKPGEPRNISASETDGAKLRCALVDISSGAGTTTSGRWRVADCTEKHYAACRIGGEPYRWRMSTGRVAYAGGDSVCQDNTQFAAPRTGLENRYMLLATDNLETETAVWVNFNSLDRAGCWVQGTNNTCPYNGGVDSSRGRKVIVPVVAGIIMLVLAALTLFIKCAANRQRTKRTRRRRGEEWVYEGVPA